MKRYTYEQFNRGQKINRTLLIEKMMRWNNLNEEIKSQKKIESLLLHLKEQHLRVAFCGHFSAGKSTIINQVIGKKLLPSHPIPTSANVVTLSKGTDQMCFYNGKNEKYVEHEVNWNKLEEICKNKNISHIDVTVSDVAFPEKLKIMDTPGIDSTDEAHELATLSSLYLADLLVYVMDYNHVLSEMNIAFLRSMTERGKKLILLINQIDKHRVEEIEIDIYLEQIEQSLNEANISYTHLFLTTMIEKYHPLNQYEQFIQTINHSLQRASTLIYENVHRELFHIIMMYRKMLFNRQKERIEKLQKDLIHDDSLENINKKYDYWLEKQINMEEEHTLFFEQFEWKLKRIFENANIMPYHTRELGRSVVEASQMNFRMKGLFGGRKTKKERDERYELFLESLNDNCLTSIEIPLKKELLLHFYTYELKEQQWKEKIHSLHLFFTREDIVACIKKGALFNDAYVRQFWKDITYYVQKKYRIVILELIEQARLALQQTLEERKKEARKQLQIFSEQIEKKRELVDIQQRIEEKINKILLFFTISKEEKEENTQDVDLLKGDFIQIKTEEIHLDTFITHTLKEKKVVEKTTDLDQIIRITEQMMLELPNISWLIDDRTSFLEKINRVKQKSFTVALFGAFSAGKSTFANAWIGEKLFPTSPNPTTAVVQILKRPNKEQKDGDIHIFYKTEAEILADINHLFRLSSTNIQSIAQLEDEFLLFEQWKKEIKEKEQQEQEEKKKEKEEKEKKNVPIIAIFSKEERLFLKAIQKGYSSVLPLLGKTEMMNEETFKQEVTKEKIAVFIEKVEIYKDCDLTRKGMILVDTPGSGSLNERHTKVAFQMIKHADAIVFLTYYNHAFSRYDALFLYQISQLREFFSKEKVTFIINASDLAHSYQELEDVYHHLKKELVFYQLNHSPIFPLSSLWALEEKKDKSGFHSFESYFEHHLKEQMQRLVIEQLFLIIQKMKRLVNKSIVTYDEEVKKKHHRLQQMKKKSNDLITKIKHLNIETESELLTQEIKELMYYVKQRVYYRYYDEFKEIFTPELLKKEEDIFIALQKATKKMIDFIILDTIQDIRTTIVRIEHYIEKRINQLVKELSLFSTIHFEKSENYWREYEVSETDFPSVSLSIFQDLLTPYQTHQDFFANDGVKIVRDGLDERIQPFLTMFIKEYESRINEHYQSSFKETQITMQQRFIQQVKQETKREYHRIQSKVSKDNLQQMYVKLDEIARLFEPYLNPIEN